MPGSYVFGHDTGSSMRTDEILEEARGVALEQLRPHSAQWDREAAWPAAGLRALQERQLGGLVVPTRYGGLGQGLNTLVQVCEVLAHEDGPTALCFGMHCVGSACIAVKARETQVERFLRPICEGRHLTTLALSEPGTGSHFYLPRTRISGEGDAYRLNGTKSFVTSGGHADSYVLSAAADDPDAPPGHFTLSVVDAETPGMTWGSPWNGWGMRGNASRTLELHDVRVPRDRRLGEEGDHIWYVFQVIAPYFLMAMTGTYLGIARRALEEALDHVGQRTYAHDGRSLAEVDILQHRVGALWSRFQRARALALWAAQESDQGGPESLPALCAAKAEVGHTVVDLVNDCLTLVGGRGYGEDHVLTRLLRDARAAHVMAPTTDLLYTWTGRALLGIPLLGD